MGIPGKPSISLFYVGSYVSQIQVTFGVDTSYVNVFIPGASTQTIVVNSSGGYASHSGLSAGSSYTATARAYSSTGHSSDAVTLTVNTLPVAPSGSASAGVNSATVTATFGSGTSYVQAFISPAFKTISSSGGSAAFTGLTAGTSYTPSIRAFSPYGATSAWVTLNSVTPTAPPVVPGQPSVQVTPQKNKILATVTFGSNTTSVNVIVRDMSDVQIGTTADATFSGQTVTLPANATLLTPNTNYKVLYRPYNGATSGSLYEISPVRTLSDIPGAWSWSFPVAVNQPCTIPAAEWISFQNKINEFRVAKGLSNYAFTTGSYVVSGKPFMAFLANQAVAAIAAMSPSVSPPAQVDSGDVFTAAWLNQLTNSLNSIT
jgi:hypothetical protein